MKMNNKEPKVYYDKEQNILYIDKETYDRDVMTVFERQQKAIEYIEYCKKHNEIDFNIIKNILQGDDE